MPQVQRNIPDSLKHLIESIPYYKENDDLLNTIKLNVGRNNLAGITSKLPKANYTVIKRNASEPSIGIGQVKSNYQKKRDGN